MRLIATLACAAFGLGISALGGDGSYVVLNAFSSRNSLVRVSSDGKSVTCIANDAAGHGLIKDRSGNYIIAASQALLKVSPAGKVSTIAEAPGRSNWMSVVQTGAGDFLVSDNVDHSVWRVSPGGDSNEIVTYPAPNRDEMEDSNLAVDAQGAIVLLEDNNGSARLFRITEAGAITPIPMSGSVDRGSLPLVDSRGDFLFLSYATAELLRVSPAGEIASARKIPGQRNMVAMAQDPATQDYIVAVNFSHRLIRVPQSGAGVTTLIENREYLPRPSALIVETKP